MNSRKTDPQKRTKSKNRFSNLAIISDEQAKNPYIGETFSPKMNIPNE